jgi:hypothetical protein
MRNVGTPIQPFLLTARIRALKLLSVARGHIREIFPEGFGLIAAKANETLAVGIEDAVIDGHHDGADYMRGIERRLG